MITIDQRAAAIAAASEAHEAAHEAAAVEYVADCHRGEHAAAAQKAKAARLAADVAFRKAIDEIDTEYPVSVPMPDLPGGGAAHEVAAAVRPVVYETCPRCKRHIGLLTDGTLKPHKVWGQFCEPPASAHAVAAAVLALYRAAVRSDDVPEDLAARYVAAVYRQTATHLELRERPGKVRLVDARWLRARADEIDPKEAPDAAH